MAKKLTALANEHVPFGTACRWAGLPPASGHGTKTDCPRCGSESACRLYSGHGWCFSCLTWFSVVTLLAEVWEMSYEDAAIAALAKIGYVPLDHAARFEQARREPEPDLAALGEALRTWCAASLPDWAHLQYEPRPAALLARCLGLLPRVKSAGDCEQWLSRCKRVMLQGCSEVLTE